MIVSLFEKSKFIIELMIACSFSFFFLKPRNHFIYRIGATIILLLTISFIAPVNWYSMLNTIRYIGFFILMLVGMYFCFDNNGWELLYCGVAGYTVQHISYLTWTLLTYMIPKSLGSIEVLSVGRFILELATYIPFFFIFKKWKHDNPTLNTNNKTLIITSFIILSAVIWLNYLRSLNSASFSDIASIMCLIYSLGMSILSLIIQFSLLEESSMKLELSTMKQILHREKEQFDSAQENIQLINMRIHDFKHQVSILKHYDVNSDFIESAENIINLYESSIKTGNDALDVLLTEKRLVCNSNNIKLTCMVDGLSLSFIDLYDLYALFGNILDNAIEAVEKIENPDMRVITITSTKIGNIFVLHEENYYNNELTFKDGLPITTKKEREFHGYGLKSIKYILQKYAGEIAINNDDSAFSIDIMIPTSNQ